jgi:hypothetical protein
MRRPRSFTRVISVRDDVVVLGVLIMGAAEVGLALPDKIHTEL